MIMCSKDIYNWSFLLWPEFHAIISEHRERRGQLPSVAIEVQQLLEEQTKLSREADAMRLPHLHDLQCKSGVMRQQHLSLGLGSRRTKLGSLPKRQRLPEVAAKSLLQEGPAQVIGAAARHDSSLP